MEATFQNKPEDLQLFYDYMVRGTEQGKKVSKQVFLNWLTKILLYSLLVSFFVWAPYGKWQTGFAIAVAFFLFCVLLMLLVSRFKPVYYSGISAYRREGKSITPKDLQFLQLPRKIRADDNWLEISSSEAVHQWRWKRVEKINVWASFIFIHVGNCPVIYVPRRDFPSDQSYREFAKGLIELHEKNKDRPVDSE